ncbi:tetratricopeptide repeat protein [Lysobacter sp. S4-A87]|uniref:tetratricopeptide repeat protein n=1 Tax=Lysobacter sp. S4-A87 TaxID=2925843 RepID=UPI001F535501|nr:tetratricopeptide repeat protein [Lysobacter sp. S4-A87]UNK50738.1 tetratricopeptide repeat protein [Lysobacter sp. S4-A87]
MTTALVAWLAVASFPAWSQVETVITPMGSAYAEPQLGSQYREDNAKVVAAVKRGDMAGAQALQRPVLEFCDRLAAPGHAMVSVASAAEYEAYVEASAKDVPIEWVDMACPSAYKMSAFLLIELKQPEQALVMLDKASAMAPYWAEPLAERGYLLNIIGRPGEGLATYQRAMELIEKFESNRYLLAATLRGMGYAQIELGDLDQAEAYYVKSLKTDPASPVAENELKYIRERRGQRL